MSFNARAAGAARNLSVLLAVGAACLAFAGAAVADAPDNDNFANATNLGSVTSTTVTGTTVDSTVELNEPQVWAALEGSVWFKWTAPASADGKAVIIRSCQRDNAFYGINQVYIGSTLESLTALTDDGMPEMIVGRFAGPCAGFWFRATAGETYSIQVGTEMGYSVERDDFDLSLRTVNVPKNDLRRKAITIKKKLPAKVTANVAGAFGDLDEWEFFNLPATVWYHFRPVKSGKLKVEACADTDAQVEAYVFKLGKKGPFKSDDRYLVNGTTRVGNMCPNQVVPSRIVVINVKKNTTYTLAVTQSYWDYQPAKKVTLKISGKAKLKKVKKKKKKK